MAHFFVTATEQEIFDAAYMGLKSQGFERCMMGNFDNECAYDDTKGHHCAIGWGFVLNKLAIPEGIEGTSISTSMFWQFLGIDIKNVSSSRRRLLNDLQATHDTARTPRMLKKGLEDFASKYGLSVPDFTLPSTEKILETV